MSFFHNPAEIRAPLLTRQKGSERNEISLKDTLPRHLQTTIKNMILYWYSQHWSTKLRRFCESCESRLSHRFTDCWWRYVTFFPAGNENRSRLEKDVSGLVDIVVALILVSLYGVYQIKVIERSDQNHDKFFGTSQHLLFKWCSNLYSNPFPDGTFAPLPA